MLDILVEGMGRINFSQHMIDRKGITDRVTLERHDPDGLGSLQAARWTAGSSSALKFDGGRRRRRRPARSSADRSTWPTLGDTYLDMSAWKKGVVWVNGHNLGRYW